MSSELETLPQTSSRTEISIDANAGEHKILGLTVEDWIKVIAFVIVLAIIASVVAAFKGAANNQAFRDLSSAFGDAAGGLAWATSHWYLFLAGMLIAPFVPAAAKWASKKLSDGQKSGLSKEGMEALSQSIIYTKKLAESEDTKLTPDQRTKAAEDAKVADEKYNDLSEEAKSDYTNYKTTHNITDITTPPAESSKLTTVKLPHPCQDFDYPKSPPGLPPPGVFGSPLTIAAPFVAVAPSSLFVNQQC